MSKANPLGRMSRLEIVEVLSSIRTNHMFLSVFNYINAHGELSNFSISFHIPYHRILERSLEKLKEFKPQTAVEHMAMTELAASYQDSLYRMSQNDYSRMEEHYDYFFDAGNGDCIKGLKMHRNSDEIHITGYVVHKVVIMPGQYRQVNSSAKTLAKKKISNQLPISKYRQFKLSTDRFGHVGVEKVRIHPPLE